MRDYREIINWIKKNKFYLAGYFFIIFQILSFYKYTHMTNPNNLLWFCSHTPIILGIAFLRKKISIIKALISVGLIAQIFWIIDYFGKLFFGVFILGVTDYMFLSMPVFSYAISIFEHFLSAILALMLTYKFKTEKKVLLYAFIYLLIILIATLIVQPEHNYNLTKYVISESVTFQGYIYVWPILAMVIVVIPTYYFQVFLHYIYKKHHLKKRKKEKKKITLF